jgi:parallel beta-helix repeat protein
LEVDGNLDVQGSAAGPAVFNMDQGGLQSEIVINGAEASIVNAKIINGVFLAKDSKLNMEGAEVYKGSGIYLQGSTAATLKNNKIYGNATGVVLDGLVKANLQFNTLVQNTYGLYVKSFKNLFFKDNSIHDNQKDVVNNTPALKLGGNYWGTIDSNSAQARIQGTVNLAPMRTLRDILKRYVLTQLPPITKSMSVALAAKERKEEAAEALAYKKFQKQKLMEAKAATTTAPAAAQAPPLQAPVAAQAAPPLPGAPEATTSAPSASGVPEATASTPPVPGAPMVPSGEMAVPPLPGMEAAQPPAPGMEAPPALPMDNGMTASNPSTSSPSLPQAGSGQTGLPQTASNPVLESSSSVPVPPEVSGSVPPPAGNMMPPAIETSAPPATASVPVPNNVSTSNGEVIPPPPDLTEQLTPAAPAAASVPPPPSPGLPENAAAPANNIPAIPPPPAVSSTDINSLPMPAASSESNPTANNQAISTPIPPAEPTEDQVKAVRSLQGVNGDIDGMQAPPLDLSPDLSSSSNTGNGQPFPSPAPAKKKTNSGASNDLDLPPLQDSDVVPPKDLELPPTDDLGNINLNSPSK